MLTREFAIKSLLCKRNRLRPRANKIEWYYQKDSYRNVKRIEIFEILMKYTNFLNQYNDVDLKERLFYFINKIDKVILCEHCEKQRCKPIHVTNIEKLTKTCCDKECRIIRQKKITTLMHANFSVEQRKARSQKIIKYQAQSFEKKYGKEKANKYKQQISDRMKGTKQSLETKQKKLKSLKGRKFSNEHRKKLSIANKNNHKDPEFKKLHAARLCKAAPKISEKLKQRIANGEFTPCITNSWTHWDVKIVKNNKIYKFRSTFEAVYWLLNPELLFETIRVPYYWEGKVHNYIIDFEDKSQRIIYEIKPTSLLSDKKNQTKLQAAQNWAKTNSYQFKIIDNNWFKKYAYLIDYEKYPSLLKGMKQFL